MTEPVKKYDSVILLSGGIDSTTLLHHMVNDLHLNPIAMIARYGQRHSYENLCALKHAKLLGVTVMRTPLTDLFTSLDVKSALLETSDEDVPDLDDVLGDPQPATYVPNRNMILLSLAAAVAESIGATQVFYGAQQSDMYGYWDATPDFVNRVNQVMGLNRKQPVKIEAPFITASKTQIIRLGYFHLGVDYSSTWSCYQGNHEDGACGQCATCKERLKAFTNLDLVDPIKYQGGDDA